MPIHTLSDFKSADDAANPPQPNSFAEPVDGEKLSKWFKGMYHEKQIGSLCAVHCLNNLLQDQEFDEIQLADIAADIDRRERQALGSGRIDSDLSSANVRADGFFSVQVILEALMTRGYQCMHLGSSETAGVLKSPEKEIGFILNRSEHWFSLRRLGKYWFDVNSMYEKPKFVSDSYLGMLLMQMKNDGYSVFVVRGNFPQTSIEKDNRRLEELVQACSDNQLSGPVASQSKTTASSAFSGSGYSLQEDNSAEIQAAFASAGVDPQEDPELAAAIAESLMFQAPQVAVDPVEEMRRKRLQRFAAQS
uniref:ubiquitinyl hydrolase 1 n=1 Tax=Guillardia theta TaxID=55529 RepID=A0A7S4UKW6_GUITH|mmetsp:Transcript_45479/g.142854  ORF Transcript_45479/g.142854 Transcript_45479/m.142854 type:complete len:306 (+) Transcript_45479:384-1301(+)